MKGLPSLMGSNGGHGGQRGQRCVRGISQLPSVTLHERNSVMTFWHVDSAVSGNGINAALLDSGFLEWV